LDRIYNHVNVSGVRLGSVDKIVLNIGFPYLTAEKIFEQANET